MAYSRAIADVICEKMAEGLGLKEICRTARETDPTFPAPSTVRSWVVQDIDGVAERYARARDAQAMHWADEILEIADDATNDWMERTTERGRKVAEVNREHIQRSSVRLEARKWLLAKLHPELFIDRVAHQTLGADGRPVDPTKHTVVVEDARPPIDTFLSEFAAAARVETKH